MLTVQILVDARSPPVGRTLESVAPARVLVADFGSGEAAVCRRAGAAVTRFSGDRAAARAALCRPGWNLWLEPGEVVLSGLEVFADLPAGPARYISLLGDGTVAKPIRVFSGVPKFENPVMEVVRDPAATYLDLVAWGPPVRLGPLEPAIRAWAGAHPLAAEPHYYAALAALERRDFPGFLALADRYMFAGPAGPVSRAMMRYYQAVVLTALGRADEAVGHLAHCLADHPLMAEFWCLLGDIFFRDEPGRAAAFYRNAQVLGARRRQDDRWPVVLDKYGDHPERMLAACRATGDAWVRRPTH